MKAGGFDTGFFISHKPECVAMADHVMIFGNGKIVIE
jgi:ABC-type sugar transport system ATPase subunit